MKWPGKIAKELAVFLKQCWFLALLLIAALFLYPAERGQEFWVWLSLSYVTSFIFYVLTIYLPQRKNQKNIHRVIVPYIQAVVSDTKGVFYAFLATSGIDCDVSQLQDSDFQKIFESINPQDPSPRLDFLGFGNWFEYLEHQKSRILRTLDRVLTYEHYLDTDFILIIENIHNSTLFEILSFHEKKPSPIRILGSWPTPTNIATGRRISWRLFSSSTPRTFDRRLHGDFDR